MAGITQATAEAQLQLWLNALQRIAEDGQSVTIGERSYSEAQLAQVQQQVDYWDEKCKTLARGGSRVRIRGITPN